MTQSSPDTITHVTKPDFLVIGAQKCATSWLYYCLHEHPGLHLPERKREVEYIGGKLYQEKGIEWYYSLFEGAQAEQRVGDVSVDYLYDPHAAGQVVHHLPDVFLIASLRHPLDRAVSAYFWYLRKNLLPDVLPLEEGLARALSAARADTPASTERPYAELLLRSRYEEQLQRYMQHVTPTQLAVVLYDDIASHPEQVIAQLYRLLGVDASFTPSSLASRPKQNSYVKPLMWLERVAPRSRVVSWVTNKANQRLAGTASKSEPPALSQALRDELMAYFRPQIAATQHLVEGLPEAHRFGGATLLERWR